MHRVFISHQLSLYLITGLQLLTVDMYVHYLYRFDKYIPLTVDKLSCLKTSSG